MPHLSPMNWLFALTSITLILSMLMSNLWWNSKQKFNPIKNLKLPTSSKWSW